MKHNVGTALGLIAVGAVLAGTGTAAAATGGTFLLGRDNTAAASTVLRNSGTAPNLTLPAARAGQAPLAVSASSGKVANFNADKLDGVDSAAFALAGGGVGSVEGLGELVDFDGNGVPDDLDADGVPDLSVAYAECPAGSKLTGGGHAAFPAAGAVISAPDGNGWLVVTFPDADTVPDDVVAVAQCYNPRGPVPAATTALGSRAFELDEAQRARLLELAARR